MKHSLIELPTFSFLLFIFFQNPSVQAVDSLARDKCRELHHVEVDGTSVYSNNNCLLRCVIKGTPNDHFMNEGFSCPLAEMGVCKGGVCVPKSSKNVDPGAKLGSLVIELLSAQFPATAGLKTPYVNVCLMNSTNPLTLPLKDMSTCSALCKANFIDNSNPKWTHGNGTAGCSGLFVEHAGVYLEAKGFLHEAGEPVFLGGISLTVPQLLSHGDNNKQLHLELSGGLATSSSSVLLSTRITFTPGQR